MHTDRKDRDSLEYRAHRRVRRKMGFFIHALVFVLVNLGLYALHELSGGTRGHHLPFWGWGLGLAIHGIVTFLSLSTDGLRSRLLAQEMETLKRREGY
ncbi:2TM domain-containing protein [Ideonella sp. BN130291]|uniref:2TM domain-containing protein n=1 Tax=Ideonella sp. BN130291 TaxID=3112940 RepID=UPI002E252941|nr:2TM domain-containing protein [Ideonella sp. BN130291]